MVYRKDVSEWQRSYMDAAMDELERQGMIWDGSDKSVIREVVERDFAPWLSAHERHMHNAYSIFEVDSALRLKKPLTAKFDATELGEKLGRSICFAESKGMGMALKDRVAAHVSRQADLAAGMCPMTGLFSNPFSGGDRRPAPGTGPAPAPAPSPAPAPAPRPE